MMPTGLFHIITSILKGMNATVLIFHQRKQQT